MRLRESGRGCSGRTGRRLREDGRSATRKSDGSEERKAKMGGWDMMRVKALLTQAVVGAIGLWPVSQPGTGLRSRIRRMWLRARFVARAAPRFEEDERDPLVSRARNYPHCNLRTDELRWSIEAERERRAPDKGRLEGLERELAYRKRRLAEWRQMTDAELEELREFLHERVFLLRFDSRWHWRAERFEECDDFDRAIDEKVGELYRLQAEFLRRAGAKKRARKRAQGSGPAGQPPTEPSS